MEHWKGEKVMVGNRNTTKKKRWEIVETCFLEKQFP